MLLHTNRLKVLTLIMYILIFEMCACLIIRKDSDTHYNHYVIALAAVPRCRSSIRYAPVVRPRGVASPIVSSKVAARIVHKI